MAKTTKGYSNCPECGAFQPVQSDGLKYLIHCTECKTFTHYQTKASKNRIEEKMLTDISDELEPIEVPIQEAQETPAVKEPITVPIATPKKPRSFFDALTEYL